MLLSQQAPSYKIHLEVCLLSYYYLLIEPLEPEPPDFVPQLVSMSSHGSNNSTQLMPTLPMTYRPSTVPKNTGLPQRQVQKGQIVTHPPPVLTYDNLVDPLFFYQTCTMLGYKQPPI